MTRHVVSVGGTGQHIALALTRLVRLGVLEPDIKLVAIDPDNQTALPKSLEAPADMRGPRHPLQLQGGVYPPFDVAKVGTAPFDKMFLDPDHPLERDLFETLFDEDAAAIEISKGMYGTPCVGATVFAAGSNGEGLQNHLSALTNSQAVFICGSVIGGTGAGVMHKLIGEIRRRTNAKLYGIFMLPWFNFAGTSGAKGAINKTLIDRNAQHGIKYFYEHTIPELTASLLIGYPGSIQQGLLKPVTVTDGEMGEVPHYLHLVAASALVTLPNAATAHPAVKAYGVVHDPHDEGWLLDEKWDPNRPTLRQQIRGNKYLLNLLDFITRSDNEQQLIGFYQKGIAGRIAQGGHGAWGGDLHDSIVNNQKETKNQAEFARDMMSEFKQLASEVRFCIKWVTTLFPGDVVNVSGDSLLASLTDDQPLWPAIVDIWRGNPFTPDVNRSTGAKDVAREVAEHHARLILKRGMIPVA